MWKTPQTIRDLFERNVRDFSDREAFVSVSYRTGSWTRHTWLELEEITNRLAAGFSDFGIEQGQKVACMLANNTESYYTYLALHKIGAIFIPINIRLASREVSYIVENAEADYLISLNDSVKLIEQIKDKLKTDQFLFLTHEGDYLPEWASDFYLLLNSKSQVPKPVINPEDIADILYTSGTTGLPKGVVLTESNKVACGRLVGAGIGFKRLHYSAPIVQNAFPFFTSSGVSSTMMFWLYYGMTVVLEPVFDTLETLKTLEREKSTIYIGAPSMYVFLLNHPDFKNFKIDSLKVAITGASAMPEEVLRQILEVWPDLKLYNTYMLTEAGTGGTSLSPSDAFTKIGSIGVPFAPDQEVRVVDHNGNNMAQGEVGEFIMRGPNIMKEYYKNPEATAETLKDGWLYTGDMGYHDEDGYFYFTDRQKDMIVRGGYNIYSVEVENVLYEHPSVKQCAVVAKPHDKLGEDIVAFVVPIKGKNITADELNQFTNDKLADFKRPRDIRFVDQIPVNPTGKIDKKQLRANFIND